MKVFLKIKVITVCFCLFFITNQMFSQEKGKGDPAVCKQLVINGAQLANLGYQHAKMGFTIKDKALASRNIDAAIDYIQQSISSIDSALFLAADSNLLAIDYATLAKGYAVKAYKKLTLYKEGGGAKKHLAESAYFLSANAVTDAYHSSFYFYDGKKKEEKKEKYIPKQITKLDVDQAMFALLNEQLAQKTEANKVEIGKLQTKLSAAKDAASKNKLKVQIQKLEKENSAMASKNQEAQVKLTEINTKIEERNKSGKDITEETVFAKGLNSKPTEEWNKHIFMDTELPETLVYQIQIGVYKNAVSSEMFKGLTPIYGKTLPQGISYSTGMFERATDAQQAKDYVKSLGLVDAFVVPYYNKKKVSMTEAAKIEKKLAK